jgi:hypothetical protein
MGDFLNRLFGNNRSEEIPAPEITVEKITQLFAYGRLKNLIGTGSDNPKFSKLGQLINWKDQPQQIKAYKDIPAQTVPPHIKWSNNPIFGYVAIVDNQVVYHYGESGESAIYLCKVTNNPKEIALLNEIFAHYYNLFNLPNALTTTGKKLVIDRNDKLKLIGDYLQNGTDEFFDAAFSNEYDMVLWVDWREEDEKIIEYCENILQTKQLHAEVKDAENEMGFDIFIHFGGNKHKIPYVGTGADRDTTITTLNEVLKPHYELRLCRCSMGSDTLAYLPLTSTDWAKLEQQFAEKVDRHFIKINSQDQ